MKYKLSTEEVSKTLEDFEIARNVHDAFIDNATNEVMIGAHLDDTGLSELIERLEARLAESVSLTERVIKNLEHRLEDSKVDPASIPL